MTSISTLRAALSPRSVAVIGASENPNKIGGRPIHYLGRFGFGGEIYPINPHRAEIQGHRSYPDLASLPEAPDEMPWLVTSWMITCSTATSAEPPEMPTVPPVIVKSQMVDVGSTV